MSDPMPCPQCRQPLTRVGKHWICPEHGQVPLPPSSLRPHPLRIFLSYGHDANEELVRRIKTDLEARGHDVWFDKNEIKFGDDWRREITDGITASHRVLSFLSKHSTRDPGVCLDEIAIAIGTRGGNIQTILVESETEVKPPASISHLQWLDMHDWKERKESGSAVPPEHPDSWETWYQAKLAEIIRVVESDESRRFAGEIETLAGHLKPIPSDSRIAFLLSKGFIGRQWLFDAVENWRNPGNAGPQAGSSEFAPNLQSSIPDPQSAIPSRLFWITGDPGVGKSAFAAHLTHFGRDKVIAAQFVEWDKPDHRNAARVVRSLAFQLATRLPDYRKLLLTLPEIADLDRKNPDELFDYLLAGPLGSKIGAERQRYLIVIDALDEANEGGRNPLVEMLARHAPRLPEWLGLVVTSRPESTVAGPLQGLNPLVLDTRTEANRADLRDYLRHQLAPQLQHRPDLSRQSEAAADADYLVEQILDKSEGVFLYAERVCAELAKGNLSLDRLDRFPQGLGGIYHQFFTRQFSDVEQFEKTIEPMLGAILAAREPLPVDILQKLFNWRETELRKWLRTLGSLFPVTKDATGETIKPYHKSLADWLADEAKAGVYFVSAMEGHETLSRHLFVLIQDVNCDAASLDRLPPYYMLNAFFHLSSRKEAFKGWNLKELSDLLFFSTRALGPGGISIGREHPRFPINLCAMNGASLELLFDVFNSNAERHLHDSGFKGGPRPINHSSVFLHLVAIEFAISVLQQYREAHGADSVFRALCDKMANMKETARAFDVYGTDLGIADWAWLWGGDLRIRITELCEHQQLNAV